MAKVGRFLLSTLAAALLAYAVWLTSQDKLGAAGTIAVIATICILWANLNKFKSFKGFGIEAELWEEKKKEADDLIEKLRNILAISTEEMLRSRVSEGRLRGDKEDSWTGHWALYQKIDEQHKTSGLEIDMSTSKYVMDSYFLFDMSSIPSQNARYSIEMAKKNASAALVERRNRGEIDEQTRKEHLAIINSVDTKLEVDPITGNRARSALDLIAKAEKRFKEIGLTIEVDRQPIDRLRQIATLHEGRPIVVTDELIRWANRED